MIPFVGGGVRFTETERLTLSVRGGQRRDGRGLFSGFRVVDGGC